MIFVVVSRHTINNNNKCIQPEHAYNYRLLKVSIPMALCVQRCNSGFRAVLVRLKEILLEIIGRV